MAIRGEVRKATWPVGGVFHRTGRGAISALLSLFTALLLSASGFGQRAERIVVIKIDGLPFEMVERFVHETDPRTGKSALPWIKHVFYENGTRLANFYVRGMSLSAPSWSLLDTGQHLQIKGNVEFDRYTMHMYDYLNFIPFYLANAVGQRVDMPGPEVLDELGLPLLLDSYPYEERFMSFQLYQRGVRWTALQRGLQNRFTSRSPRELIDEWTIGFEARSILYEQMERELLEKLRDSRIRYLDIYNSDFDHRTHHNRDRESHLEALQEIDALVGRIWTAIEKSPLAAQTALVLVSDHGTNSDERVYSQGYNLVKYLASATGGGHHVVTKRRLLNDYAIKGFYPIVSWVVTTTPDTYYLRGQSTVYPTALVDFDGNERVGIHLRNSDLNALHILLQQLQRRDLAPDVRRAATDAFFAVIERNRAEWSRKLTELEEELGALRRLIERQRAAVAAQPKKWTKEDRDKGRDQEARREYARMDSWLSDEREYTAYARTLRNLLSLRRESFTPETLKIKDLIAPRAMGEPNSIHQLQNYVFGLGPQGLVLAPDGALDLARSFRRMNYFAALYTITLRNNVQSKVGNRPVDFIAVRLPAELLVDQDLRAEEAIWLYGGEDAQALILGRRNAEGALELRYVPVAQLAQHADGTLNFTRIEWRSGLPLKIWEDERLRIPDGEDKARWLSVWHTEIAWLHALHRTKYANALIGLHEQFARHSAPTLDLDAPGLTSDERLIRRFRLRQRHLVETDLFVHANFHWNFDVRGFNPGGNHGSFYRVSTHSTLMIAGGTQTGIPRGMVIEEPYDSLSFVPTLMALTGRMQAGQIAPVLWQRGFRSFPGRIIRELFEDGKPRPAFKEGGR
ncbi:alkaline phosphatase family protein [Pyrinomonas sp.]|uniref:alkaline phosphatase family protein n=1 Tax=Pyrinomonas sp. TaxID=2080306 RepID=UPI00332F78AB